MAARDLRAGERPTIEAIHAREILDSRGNPTVAVAVATSFGVVEEFCVPAGASTGAHEAVELRDGDMRRYHGKGVRKAVAAVNEKIAPELLGFDATDQVMVDAKLIDLDGTPNKGKLGANAILGVSIATARAAATSLSMPLYRYLGGLAGCDLPVPMMNVINGGKHAEGALQFQECMIVPVGADNFAEAVRYGSETFHALGKILHDRKLPTLVGDEGGYAPPLRSLEDAMELLIEAIQKAGYRPKDDIAIALDSASTEFYTAGQYYPNGPEKAAMSASDLVRYYEKICNSYPVVSIEDGLAEDDWEGWKELTARLGARIQLVGDDLFVTNTERLARGISEAAGNAILVKVNQIGTLSETLDTIHMAQRAGFACVISHRSGETGDTTIADIAVGMSAGQIKTGSLSRSDRVEKYNRLMLIEEELAGSATYPGPAPFAALG